MLHPIRPFPAPLALTDVFHYLYISYLTEAEARHKNRAGEDLSAQETKFMTGYSSQIPCSILVLKST